MNFWYWLLSWLPFEWAAPDTMLFMKNALLAVLVVTPLFGLLSTMVVESRMAFFSDALGHSAFTGMAIGALCGLAQPVGAAVLFSVVIALLFTLVRQKTHMASDTAISVFSSAAVALGIFLSTELKRQRANANFFAGAFFISNVYCARRIVPHKYDRERHFRAMLLHLTYFCRHFRAQTLCQLLTVYYVQVRSP